MEGEVEGAPSQPIGATRKDDQQAWHGLPVYQGGSGAGQGHRESAQVAVMKLLLTGEQGDGTHAAESERRLRDA